MTQAYISALHVAGETYEQQLRKDSATTSATATAMEQAANAMDSTMEKSMDHLAESMGQMVGHLSQAEQALKTCAQQMSQTLQEASGQTRQELVQGAKAQTDTIFGLLHQLLGNLKTATDATLDELGKH